ncbi:MAG: DUF2760 domain-containing protein [Planctomycetia bacterium]|nr:DUF2760 domain-containing protein [Planctomycetia bacterium]
MSRFFLAIQVWWRTLVDAEFGRQVAELLAGPPPAPALPPASAAVPAKFDQSSQKQPEAPQRPQRSAALTLLATLQREARLVDFLMESIGEYSDAQIGAAVRDIHRDSAGVLERLFKIRPIDTHEEGAEIQAPAEADRYRLIGTVRGAPPHRGRLVHHGWEAAKCDLPDWSGNSVAAQVIAPVEVELLA